MKPYSSWSTATLITVSTVFQPDTAVLYTLCFTSCSPRTNRAPGRAAILGAGKLAGALPHDSQVSPIKIRGIVIENVARAEAKVRDSGLHWTIVRVLMLTDQAARASFRLDMLGKAWRCA